MLGQLLALLNSVSVSVTSHFLVNICFKKSLHPLLISDDGSCGLQVRIKLISPQHHVGSGAPAVPEPVLSFPEREG